MTNIDFVFTEILPIIKNKPQDMAEYTKKQMSLVNELLHDMPQYACPSFCSSCCSGSILMSYVEYINILLSMNETELEHIFSSQLGVMEDGGKLRCPFIQEDKDKEHCAIYEVRPLICRVFGTSASPCQEEIKFPQFPDELFYHAYNTLYYMTEDSFIGLPLPDDLVLYEAPFDIWAIADSGKTAELIDIFKRHGSMRSVLFNLNDNSFFTMKEDGKRQIISWNK